MKTVDTVLNAAIELFAQNGYVATTTRALASRAGVNEVTIFRRFGSKAGVLQAIAERIRSETAGEISIEELRSHDTREALRRLATAEVRSGMRYGGITMRMAFDAASVPEVRKIMGKAVPGNLRGLTEFMAARQRRGDIRSDLDPETIAEAFFAHTSSFVMYRAFLAGTANPSSDNIESRVEDLLELFWSGAGTKTERDR